MRIQKQLIDHYLRHLTMGRAIMAPDPMADLAEFDPDIRAMHRDALINGDMEWLRLSLDALLADPHGRITEFEGAQYPFNEGDLIAIFSRAYEAIWPDKPVSEPGNEAELEFVEMSEEEWAELAGGNG